MKSPRSLIRVPLMPVSLEAIVDVLEDLDPAISPIPEICPDKLENCRRRLGFVQMLLRIMPREDNALRIVAHRVLNRIEAARHALADMAKPAETEEYPGSLDLGDLDDPAFPPPLVPAGKPVVHADGA